MNAKLPVIALSLSLAAGVASAAGNQPVQTDYQRIMNSVNNSSGSALGQPQPDDDAVNTTGEGTTANSNTQNAPPATNQNQATNFQNNDPVPPLPTDGIANTYSANGTPGATGPAFNNRVGFNGANNVPGAASTTSGGIGLGAYNASPYNSAPASGGRAGFTGQ